MIFGRSRPTDDQAMTLLRSKIQELAPGVAGHAAVADGRLVEPHAGWSVAVLPNHTDSRSHFDLAMTVGPGQPPLVDCVSGLGEGRRGFRTLLHIWAETSGACFLEIVAGFDRPGMNGIKAYLCRTPDALIAEIRVNGRVAERATEALTRLPWPDLPAAAIARFYAVAVRPI